MILVKLCILVIAIAAQGRAQYNEEDDIAQLELQLCSDDATNTAEDQKYFPHMRNCNMYYQCAQGQLTIGHCLPGLHFSPQENTCDFPEKARCLLETVSPENENSSNESSTAPEIRENVEIDNSKTTDEFIQAAKVNSEIKKDNQNDSSSPEERNSTPVIFHDSVKDSELPNHNQASDRTINMNKDSSLNSTESPQTKIFLPECINATFIPHECSAIHFYRCIRGQKIKMRCPEGRFFDAERLVCDWPPRGKCTVAFANDCTPTSVYFPDYEDPTSFYQCSNGEFIKFQCPTELVFNRELNVCDWPRNVDGSLYQPKVNRVNCFTEPCEENRVKNDPQKPIKGFYIQDNSWAPVAGPRMPENTESAKGDNKKNPGSVKWPCNRGNCTCVENTECHSQLTVGNALPSNSGGKTSYLLTASTGEKEDKGPVGWIQSQQPITSPTSRDSGVFNLNEGSVVQVSVNTALGTVDVTNNSTDFTIHFKPGKEFENKALSSNMTLAKDANGIVTLRANLKADEENASFVVKIKEK